MAVEIFAKVVFATVIIVLGLLGLTVALGVATLAVAIVRSDAEKEPFHATFGEALCDIQAALLDPKNIGMQNQLERLIAEDGTIRFTSLSNQWRIVCLTSVGESGGVALPYDAVGELLHSKRPICWDWSTSAITVFLLTNVAETYPFQLTVPPKAGGRDVNVNYQDLRVPSGFSVCAVSDTAVARCVETHAGWSKCTYLFAQSLR